MKKSEFPYVDLLKFLFALGVVLEHSFVGFIDGGLYMFWNACILRLAIPFFFVASGFFLGRKIYNSGSGRYTWGGYYRRMILKLIFFETIAVILNAFFYLLNGMDFIKIILLAGRSVLFYPWGALWYIQAVLAAVLIIIPLARRNREWAAVAAGIVFYGFALLCNRYYFIVAGSPMEKIVKVHNLLFVAPRNGVCYGMLFVAIGMLISKNWNKISDKKIFAVIGLVISYLLFIGEFFAIRGRHGTEDASMHVMMIAVCPLLFIVAAQYSYFPIRTEILRNLSISIYLLHSPVIVILNIFGILITGKNLSCALLNALLLLSIIVLIGLAYVKKGRFYKLIT